MTMTGHCHQYEFIPRVREFCGTSRCGETAALFKYFIPAFAKLSFIYFLQVTLILKCNKFLKILS
jgi:hypothetical protein